MKENQLIDGFGRKHTYLRISVTDRCNLRCTYCMPPQGIDWKDREALLTFEEIYRIARVFADLGVEKIRFTGGEPLVRKELEVLIELIHGLRNIKTLAMTTNGTLLRQKAKSLKEAGLNTITISLDTLKKQRFEAITKRDTFHDVLAGLDEAMAVGFDSVKLNVVVMKGINDDELMDFVILAQDNPLNVRFIEYMPFPDNQWSTGGLVPYLAMKETIERVYSLEPLHNYPTDVGKDFKIKGFQGSISFITSMTESFCQTCNRLRLTSDGAIKTCLFHPAEVNVRDPLRQGISDTILAHMIQETVFLKQEAHLPMEELLQMENRAMIEIGG